MMLYLIASLLIFTILILDITAIDNDILNDSDDKEELSIYPVIMPMIVPAKNEVYLCTSVDLR